MSISIDVEAPVGPTSRIDYTVQVLNPRGQTIYGATAHSIDEAVRRVVREYAKQKGRA